MVEHCWEQWIFGANEILVMHSIGHFPDGTKKAIITVHTLSNSKIVKTESGATRIDKQKNFINILRIITKSKLDQVHGMVTFPRHKKY